MSRDADDQPSEEELQFPDSPWELQAGRSAKAKRDDDDDDMVERRRKRMLRHLSNNSSANRFRDWHARCACQRRLPESLTHLKGSWVIERRFLWMLIISSAAIGFTIHLAFLITRYSELRVSTQTEVMARKFVFPDVTICSTDTFSRLRQDRKVLIDKLNVTFSELINVMRAFWSHAASDHPANSNEVNDEMINSLKGFVFQLNVTSQPQDMIIHCHYLGKDCTFEHFSLYFDPRALSCFIFSPSDRYIVKGGGQEGGLKVIMYMGDGISYPADEHALGYVKGVRVAIHPKGTRPNMELDGFFAESGHNTIVRLGYKQIHMLDKPSQSCTNQISPRTFVNLFDHARNMHSFNYTMEDCYVEHYQQYLAKQCQCLSEMLPVPAKLAASRIGFCHHIPDDVLINHSNSTDAGTKAAIEKIYASRECHDGKFQELHRESLEGYACELPCESHEYSIRITRSRWPSKEINSAKFLKREILSSLARAKELRRDTLVLQTLSENFPAGKVADNFLKLDVYAQSQMGDNVEETWVYPARNLFSDLGGILGLWLGVSTITLFEFLEFALQLIFRFIQRRVNKKRRRKRTIMNFDGSEKSEENGVLMSTCDTVVQLTPQIQMTGTSNCRAV